MAEELKEIQEQNGENVTIADAQRIDAIKSLLFGENMEEYDHKFDDLFDKLEHYHNEFEERVKKLHRKHQDEMKAMTTQFEERINLMEKEIAAKFSKMDDNKSDRRELGKMLRNISEQLQK